MCNLSISLDLCHANRDACIQHLKVALQRSKIGSNPSNQIASTDVMDVESTVEEESTCC